MSTQKRVSGVQRHGSTHMVGDGFHVRNLFPSNALGERISPFLLLDYFGPSTFGPTDLRRGVGEHPHRGFETVTILFDGEVAHRDSAGNAGTIGRGDVQWMTAASGVVHEEYHGPNFAREGGTFHGAQLWVNLPAAHKLDPPRYQELSSTDIPTVELAGGARVRVIAGDLQGTQGPAQTVSPLTLLDVHVPAGAEVQLDWPEGHTAAVALLSGKATVNGSPEFDDASIAALDLAGDSISLRAVEDTHALVLGGEPLGETVESHGPLRHEHEGRNRPGDP